MINIYAVNVSSMFIYLSWSAKIAGGVIVLLMPPNVAPIQIWYSWYDRFAFIAKNISTR